MDEIQQPLIGQALLQKVRETPHLSRREVALLCGYYKITESNQRKTRLTDFYNAVMAARKEEERMPRSNYYSLETSLDRNRASSGIKLLRELSMSCGDVSTINVSTPPLYSQNYNNADINAYFDQGFTWHPNFVGFKIRNEIGGCWIKVYVSERLELQDDTEITIIVPYRVSAENCFYLSDEDSEISIDLDSGQYQLLYQNRYLSNSEIESLGDTFDYFNPEEDPDPDGSRPELCLLTFIPTTEEIEPQILHHEPEFNPPSELIMFSEPMLQH